MLLYLCNSRVRNTRVPISAKPKGMPMPRPSPKAKEFECEELGAAVGLVVAAAVVLMEFVVVAEEAVVVLEAVIAAIWSGRNTIVPTGTEIAAVLHAESEPQA